jgi:hypothetical protein
VGILLVFSDVLCRTGGRVKRNTKLKRKMI